MMTGFDSSCRMFGSTVSIEEHDDGRRRLVEFEVAETLDSVTGAEG